MVRGKCLNYQMILPRTYLDNPKLIQGIKNINGYVVECGTLESGVIERATDICGEGREYFLFDSFKHL